MLLNWGLKVINYTMFVIEKDYNWCTQGHFQSYIHMQYEEMRQKKDSQGQFTKWVKKTH